MRAANTNESSQDKRKQSSQTRSLGDIIRRPFSKAMDALTGTPEYHSISKKPVRQTLILAIASLCVFTSFQALQNLQSSINQEQGLGDASLACIYGLFFLVSILTPAIIYNFGVRGTILVAWLGHFVYSASNFYQHWAVLIPGSLVLGAVSCPLWTSLNIYLSSLSMVVVEQDFQKTPKVVTTVHAAFSRLNGLFHCIFSASQLTGNLLSSTILFQSSHRRSEFMSSSSSSVCGAEYCPQSGEGQKLVPPEPYIVYIMLGVFLGLDAAGIVITWFFVPNLEQPRYTGREVLRKLRSYWQAFVQPKVWLLVPFFSARGFIFSLHVGLFTEAYVSCALGIRMVGYVMAVWGLSTMLSAVLLGYAARYTGRGFLFGFSFLVEAGILVVFLLWRPHAGSMPVFFCLSALMGLVGGIWQVQNNDCREKEARKRSRETSPNPCVSSSGSCDNKILTIIVVLFPAFVDSAFSVSSTWHTLITSASFVMAKFLCPTARLYIALGMLGAAVLGYVAVEVVHRRNLKIFNRDDHQYMLMNMDGETGEGEEEGETGMQETELKENGQLLQPEEEQQQCAEV